MKMSIEVFKLRRKPGAVSGLFLITFISIAVMSCGDLCAKDQASSIEYLSDEGEVSAKHKMAGNDYFTIDSTDEDVRRIQGEPDDKFYDGDRRVWYYGKDAVYFDLYGKVVDVQDYSGNLRFK